MDLATAPPFSQSAALANKKSSAEALLFSNNLPGGA
jgi:hypothetical protein